MTTKHTLTLLAVALSATSALQAQPETPETATAILQNISAPAQPASATLEQRTAKLGILALIPADAESFIAIPHAAQSARNLLASPLLQMALQGKQANILPQTDLIKSLALASGPGSSRTVGKSIIAFSFLYRGHMYQQQLTSRAFSEYRKGIMQLHESDLDEPAQQLARKKLTETNQKNIFDSNRHMIRALAMSLDCMGDSWKNISLTGVAELAPEAIAFIPSYIEYLKTKTSSLPGNSLTWHQGTYAGYEWKGLAFDGQAMARFLENEYRQHSATPDDNERRALQMLATVKFHYLMAVKDNKLLLSICTNPAKDIRLAATPQDSILATGKAAFADARLIHNPDCLSLVDRSFFTSLHETARGLVDRLPEELKTPQMLEKLDFLTSTSSENRSDTTCLIWADKGIHIETTSGASEDFDLNSPLRLLSFADKPGTILYAEYTATPLLSKQILELAEIELADTFGPLPPQVQNVWKHTKTVFSGMTGQTGIFIDNKGIFPTDIPDKEHGLGNLILPRIALYKGVGNRQTIADGWNLLYKAADRVAEDILDCELPASKQISKTPVDTYQFTGIDSYTVDASEPGEPAYSIDLFSLCLSGTRIAITDKTWVIGTESLVTDVAVAAEAPASGLKGAAFALRTAPIQTIIDHDIPIMEKEGTDIPSEIRPIATFISSQIEGLYGITTAEGNKTRSHIYLRTK